MKKLAILVSLAALTVGSSSALAAPPAPSAGNPSERAVVCHVTGSVTNPVVYVYVPSNAKPPRKACAPGVEPAPVSEQPSDPAPEYGF